MTDQIELRKDNYWGGYGDGYRDDIEAGIVEAKSSALHRVLHRRVKRWLRAFWIVLSPAVGGEEL